MDLYFNDEEKKAAIETIYEDAVYREDRQREEEESTGEESGST